MVLNSFKRANYLGFNLLWWMYMRGYQERRRKLYEDQRKLTSWINESKLVTTFEVQQNRFSYKNVDPMKKINEHFQDSITRKTSEQFLVWKRNIMFINNKKQRHKPGASHLHEIKIASIYVVWYK